MLREFPRSMMGILSALGKIGCHLGSRTSRFNDRHNCFYQEPTNFSKLGDHPKALACVQEARPAQLRLHFAGPDLINLDLHPGQSV